MAQSVVIISIKSECTTNATTKSFNKGTFRKKPLVASYAGSGEVCDTAPLYRRAQEVKSQRKNHVFVY